MDILPARIQLSLLTFFYLAFLIQAKLNLDSSDSDAIKLFKNELSFNGQFDTPENLCNSTGVHCERRILFGNSPVLRVTRIVMDSVSVKGSLSPAIGQFSELKELSLPNNYLLDQIPSEIVDCRKLQVLNLRNNRLSGDIPSEFSSLVSLRVLDLSSNSFTGDVSFLKYLTKLESLSLSNNLFTGRVPASLYKFRHLRYLSLSGNKNLQVPVQRATNGVENSHTELRTKNLLPKRYVFAEEASAPAPSKANNSNSSNSTKSSAPRASKANNSNSSNSTKSSGAHPPSSPKHKKKSKKRNVRAWIIGFIVGAITGILSGVLFSVLFKFLVLCIKGREKETSITIFSQMIKKAEDLAFLEKEDGLESLEVIGRGGCGEVYKAELPGSSEKTIAIKKVIQPQQLDADDLTKGDSKLLSKKMRQIRSEIQTVGQIRHRNLLPLLAHVSRPDCHCLVYEYMKNGSLQDVLKQVSEGTRELDWLLRHRISIGVAAGLEYLHMNHSPRIIHRDLKPANVLLDDNLEARIADFGLAKAMPDAHTHVTTSNVAGTIGYIAPEYHQTLKFTDKCDIYSFGVLLAALVMGKLPSDEFFQHTEEMSQVKWLRNVMTSESPSRAIDPKLIGNGYEEQMLLVLKIACFCSLDDPKERPNSRDVRHMLSQIKH